MLIRTARTVNDAKPHHVAEQVAKKCERFVNPTVACLGLAYKANVDDLRESPLVELCERGLERRYDKVTPELRERLQFELKTIKEMGFADYFLIVWDFIHFAKVNGIGVGPGRGSAAGSLAAYALEITDIDPIRYDLLFERFLNPGRKSMPDIDIDFAVEGRERVINYVAEKYGRDRVAQIITFSTMAARASPTTRLNRVLLPTLGRPTRATMGRPREREVT